MVAVAHDQQIEVPIPAGRILDLPSPSGRAPGMDHRVVELDGVQQAEGFGVGIQIGLDVGVMRKGREVIGDRKVLEGQPMFGGVDVQ